MDILEQLSSYQSLIRDIVMDELLTHDLVKENELKPLELKRDSTSNSTSRALFSYKLFSWAVKDIVNNSKNALSFMNDVMNQSAASNAIVEDVEDRVQCLFDSECELWVEECYFFYQTSEEEFSISFHLTISSD